MKRLTGILVLAVVLLLPLTACTAQKDQSEQAIKAWANEKSKSDALLDTDAVGSAASSGGGGSVTLGLEAGSTVTVTGLAISCYGAPTLRFEVSLTTATSTQREQTDPVKCDKKSHTIPLAQPGVSEVTVKTIKAPPTTAWFVTVRGT